MAGLGHLPMCPRALLGCTCGKKAVVGRGTVAVEGARRSSLASWQVLLVPEPGNPCLEVPSTHKAGPAFLQAERVVGTLGWLGCGHQAGQWSATRTETADSTGWLQSHRAHKH